jgi:putative transposase
VPWTGEIINNLGGKKKVKSKLTNTWMDRDISGALGILLKALVDTPSLDVFRSAFVNKH